MCEEASMIQYLMLRWSLQIEQCVFVTSWIDAIHSTLVTDTEVKPNWNTFKMFWNLWMKALLLLLLMLLLLLSGPLMACLLFLLAALLSLLTRKLTVAVKKNPIN